jgi:hypothetical protein
MSLGPRVASSTGLWLGAGATVLLGLLALRHYPAASAPEMVVCLFRLGTGIPCPGCGLTRAFLALAAGDLGRSLVLHPLAPLFAIEALLAWLLWGAHALGRLRRTAAPWDRLALAHAAALLALWIVRLTTGTLPG